MPIVAAGYTMRDVVADLREMPADVRRRLRPALVKVAQPMLASAKRRAGWSSRIPGAIGLSLTKNGVLIRVNVKKAPHARAYEGISSDRAGNFRHPVFGDRDVWVTQRERPFLVPGVQEHRSTVEPAIRQVVQEAARARGFR